MTKKIIKNLLLIAAMFVMCFAMSMTASAETITGECGAEGDNVTWTLDIEVGSLVINGTGAMKDYGYGSSPFYENLTIKSVVIETGVTSIGNSAFYGCTSLANIEIPDSVITIGDSAFSGCTGLASIEIPNSVTTIGARAFSHCTGLANTEIPDSVTTIGDSAFYGCTGLANIEIPDSVTTIGDSAFHGCTGLANIEIPDSVTTIGDSAFSGCTGLANIEIPDSVTTIGDSAFSGCTGLASIEIPDSVTTIGDSAFSGCTGLANIEIPDSVTSIGIGPFLMCTSLESLTVDENNLYYSSDEYGALFNKDKTELICYPCNAEADLYVIPSTVKTISPFAFAANDSVKEITIPEGVKEIGPGAFYLSNLKEITIPEGVKEIGYLAFAYSNFEKINLPSSLEKIGHDAFLLCILLNDVVLPENLAVIESGAFIACESLTDITVLSKNVEGYENSGLGHSYIYHDEAFFETLNFIIEEETNIWNEKNSKKVEENLSELVFYDIPQPFGVFYRHDDSESYSVDSYAEENGFELVRTHFYDEWSTTVEPTCSKAGEEIRHCTYCDYFETNELETKDHTFGDWTYDWDNCIRTRKCELCEATETENLETNTEGDAEIIAPSNPDADFDIESIINGDERYVLVENSMNTYHGGYWKIVKIFDITLKSKDGVHVQPDGTVKVKLPHDWIHNNYKVYRVNDDGTITDMKAYQEGSHVVFETDHFSLYVIVDESAPEEPDTPSDGEVSIKSLKDLIAWFKQIIDDIVKFFRSIGKIF